MNCYKSSSSSVIVVQRKVGNQVRSSSSKNCRKLSNFGFINCLVGSFLFVFWETREREQISVKLSEMMSSKRAQFLPSLPSKKLKLNCTEIERTSETVMNWPGICFVFRLIIVHTHTPIYVWTVFDFRTSGFKIQNETQKENEKIVWFWFLFDLFYFLAPQF